MGGKNRPGKYIKFCIYLVILVLVNVAGITLFFRIDLTANKLYSISDASKEVVSTLSEPLTIKVFFTRDLPAPHNNTERYLRDLLEEYGTYANKYFNYRFYDVSAAEGELSAETRENQSLANNYGIHPIQIQVIEKDEVKFQRAYMGMVIIHGDLIERIPTITATQGLEYKLTTAFQKLNNKISALLGLSNPIAVKLFLSSSLEAVAPFIGLKNLPALPDEMESIVTKLSRRNYNKLNFEHINPSAEKELDQVSNEYNVMTLKWPQLSNGKIPPGRGAIGLLMEHGDKTVNIPLLQVINMPIFGTQYKLMNKDEIEDAISANVEALININEDLGYLSSHGTLTVSGGPTPFDQNVQQNQEALNNFGALMSQNYSFKNINLKDQAIPEGIQCLAIVGPKDAFSDYELYQIDQFLMRGRSLFLILDRFDAVMPAGQQGMNLGNREPVFAPLNTGLEKLLSHYGIRIKKSYVLDQNCFHQEMPARLGGGERPIYFVPLIKNQNINKDLEFLKTIKSLVALRISPLELISERIEENGLNAHRLFASSEKSWEMSERINLNPMFSPPPPPSEEMKQFSLAYIIEGEFSSYFEGKPIPVKEVKEDSEKDSDSIEADIEKKPESSDQKLNADLSKIESLGQFVPRGKPGKIFLMASSDMLKDNVLDARGNTTNATFIMNVIDYLNDREDIAVMRGKEQRFNPLDDTQAGTKTFIKTFNIAGLPVLVVIFGLLVWFRRHARKKHIRMMFQK